MFWRGAGTSDPLTPRRCRQPARRASAKGGQHDGQQPSHGATPSGSGSSRTRPARSRSSGSRTPTSRAWSSATSTPRAACSAGRSSCMLEDGATDDAVAAAKAREARRARTVDVVFGGIYSSTRQAIKGPAVVEGKTLYLYPEQYEGQESDPLIFCTGPVPAQQVDPFIPWLMRETGAKTFYLPSADYIWPHVLNARVREVVDRQRRLDRRRGVPPARPHGLRATVERIMASGADVVFNTIVPPGVTPFFEALYESGFTAPRRAASSARTSTRTSSTWSRPRTSRGSTAASTTTRPSATRSAEAARAVRRALSRRRQVHRRQRAAPASTARSASGPRPSPRPARSTRPTWSPRSTTPRSPRARAGRRRWCPASTTCACTCTSPRRASGRFEIVESLGAIDPQEREVEIPALAG